MTNSHNGRYARRSTLGQPVSHMQNKQAIQSKLERLFMPDITLSDQQLIETILPHILENEAKGVLQDLLIKAGFREPPNVTLVPMRDC